MKKKIHRVVVNLLLFLPWSTGTPGAPNIWYAGGIWHHWSPYMVVPGGK
jgi:hypothetical protein